MKKIIACIMIALLMFALCACTSEEKEPEPEAPVCQHVWNLANCIAPATCRLCGATVGEIGSHPWQQATCKAPQICLVCGLTEGEIGDHRWKTATCTAPKTCRDCGKTEGKPLGHTKNEKCTRCGSDNIDVAIQNAQNAIHIYGIDLEMDSAGGVDTYITWENTSRKEIKYVTFTVQYYNRVNDVLYNEVGYSKTVSLQATGPYPHGKGNYVPFTHGNDIAESLYFTVRGHKNNVDNGWANTYWSRVFYNKTTQYVKLVEIEITYMNGEKYTISNPTVIAAVVGSGKHVNNPSWLGEDPYDDYLRD